MHRAPQCASRGIAGLALVAGAIVLLAAQTPAPAPTAPQPRGLVLVELFTSEGCPHCPEADALLEHLYSAQAVDGAEIVPIEEHVDYWDRPEWVDRFSAPRYTERQRSYAEAMDLETMYTPQMVVDGLVEFVGNNEGRARATISVLGHAPLPMLRFLPADARAAAAGAGARPQVRVEGKEFALGGTAAVYVVLAEDKLISRVGGGQNAGESWKHSSIARGFYRVGTLRPEEKSFSAGLAFEPPNPEWRVENLRLIAFVQEDESHKVAAIGAARWQDAVGAARGSASSVSPAQPDTSKPPGPPLR